MNVKANLDVLFGGIIIFFFMLFNLIAPSLDLNMFYTGHLIRLIYFLFIFGVIPIVIFFILGLVFLNRLRINKEFRGLYLKTYSFLPLAGFIYKIYSESFESGILTSYYFIMHIGTIVSLLLIYLMFGILITKIANK